MPVFNAIGRHGRTLTLLALCVALTLPLAACGKKGELEPPPSAEDSPYPRTYPTK